MLTGNCLYKGSARKLQEEIFDKLGERRPLNECEEILAHMQEELYPVLFAHIDQVFNIVAAQKFISTPLGQIRWLPHVESAEEGVRERAKREGWNHQNQSVGHGCLQFAMHKLQQIIEQEEKPWKILVDTHDGFLAETPEGDVAEIEQYGVHLMQSGAQELLGDWLRVPLPVEVAVGTHWGDLKVVSKG
jgi:DNA polymerase I-like protein with 3'-5' exonuclease and polymerase domains